MTYCLRKFLILPGFILLFPAPPGAMSAKSFWGTWEGVMGTGSHSFRVAFNLNGLTGKYNNIDDGIYDEPMTLQWSGRNLTAQTDGGGALDLSPSPDGKLLTGFFRQGEGRDSHQSLVGQANYPVTLHQGEDDLYPRLGPDGKAKTSYEYAPPEKKTDGWETGDLRRNPAKLQEIQAAVRDVLQGKYPHIHGLLIVKDGKLVLEEYFYGFGPQELHPLQSVTKNVFSLLFGIGMAQGLVEPNQKLFDYFPEYRSISGWDPAKDAITLKSLLTMTSGFGCDDFKDSESCSWRMVATPDWLDTSLSLPQTNPPGSHFAYCGACLTPLGVILERKSGMSLPDYAQKFLFGPLGISSFVWFDGPKGIHVPAAGLSLTPRDMAKLGWLVLKKGNWNGQEVVPASWIAESTKPWVSHQQTGKEADYGYLWWERDVTWNGKKLRSLDAWGNGGQHIFIVPDLDLVCVLTGGNYKNGPLANNSFKIFHEVLEAFR